MDHKTFLPQITLFILLLLYAGLLKAQENRIPWIPLMENAPDTIAGRNGAAPTYGEIGIPIYPGSFLTSVYIEVFENDTDGDSPLPGIYLVTSDDKEKVIQFYKDTLNKSNGWIYNDEYFIFTLGTTDNPFSRTIPGIAIREESGESFDLIGAEEDIKKSLKTRVKIIYIPVK